VWLTRRDWLKLGVAGAGALALGGVSIAGCQQRADYNIGAKDFPEQWILSELLATVTAGATGASCDRVTLSGTLLCHQALLHGDIQAYVEYTGTGLTAVLAHDMVRDPREVYRIVQAEYARRFDLQWLSPLGFENTFAVLVRRADAERESLRTISDLRRVQERFAPAMAFEFYDRPDGYRGMIATYGLAFSRDAQQMSLGNVYRSVAAGEVDIGVGNSTDGLIEHLDLVALEDDRQFFPPYEPAVVIRGDVARAHPELVAAYERLAGAFATDLMRRANYEVDHEKRHPAPVARDLLARVDASAHVDAG
jgi:glycine betaine/choline ABC-type transport system substrate-binding protein